MTLIETDMHDQQNRQNAMNPTIFSEQHFHKELVHRFFHPNSYFSHCMQGELDLVLTQLYGPEKDHYLLIGNLMDKLVSASDSYLELQNLSKIHGFAEFNEKLVQGTRYLYATDVDRERMKAEIEALAHSMFNSALLAFQDAESMTQIRSYLGLAEPLVPASREFRELPSEDPEEEMTEPNQEGREDFPEHDESGEPDVFLRAGDDMEVVPEDESENDSDEGSSYELVQPTVVAATPMAQEVKRPDREPESLVESFQQDLQRKLHELDTLVTADYTEKTWKRAFKQVLELVDAIGISAMIHGVEAVEQLALKTKKGLQQLAEEEQATQGQVVPLAHGLKKAGDTIMLGNLEKVDVETVKSLTEEILSPHVSATAPAEKVAMAEPTTQSQTEACLPQKRDGLNHAEVVVTPQAEGAMPPQAQADPEPFQPIDENEMLDDDVEAPQTDTMEGPLTESIDNPDFKLPGEDDQEILDLLAEVCGNDEHDLSTGIDLDDNIVADPAGPEQTDEVVDDFLSLDYKTEESTGIGAEPYQLSESVAKAPAPTEEAIVVTSVTEDGTSPLSVYKRQARLYISVIEESIGNLAANGSAILALEDIELAANALHSLALKLDIEAMARFPDLLLTISQSAANVQYKFTESDLNVMTEALQVFRSLTNVTAVETPPFTERLTSLEALSERIVHSLDLKIEH